MTALRKALEELVNRWAVGGNGIDAASCDLISACSAELLRVLDEHPEAPDDEYRLTEAGKARADAEAPRYALVEQMGHRATVAAVREVTFCGTPMLEVTDLKTGSVHLAAPQSLYEVSWLTETEARQRVKPWTAHAITAGDPWGTAESDLDDEADEENGKDGCSCYRGPDAHEHDSDEDGDCRRCGCGRYSEPIGADL